MKHLKQITFDEYRLHHGRGGPREGAGRPARRPGIVHHVRRPKLRGAHPAHVTLRVLEGVPSLRRRDFIEDFKASLARAVERNKTGGFRVVHYSIQRNHVHLLVEAMSKEALGRGMKSISTRLVWAARRVFGISGKVLDGRYHLRVLETPREVRNALAYVLLNVRKHFRQRNGKAPPPRLDVASSGRWFDGWKPGQPELDLDQAGVREVSTPHSWLLKKEWRRHRLILLSEVSGAG